MQEFTSVFLVEDYLKGLCKDLSLLTVLQKETKKKICFFPLFPDFKRG